MRNSFTAKRQQTQTPFKKTKRNTRSTRQPRATRKTSATLQPRSTRKTRSTRKPSAKTNKRSYTLKESDMRVLLDAKPCDKKKTLTCQYLTAGAEGDIDICDIGGGKFILKTFKELEFYKNEWEIIQKIPSTIGAKLITHWKCDGKGYMIFEKWDGSLNDLFVETLATPNLKPTKEGIKNYIQPQLDTLRKKGLYHNDLHWGNILYRRIGNEDGNYEYTLTDFGQTSETQKPHKKDHVMFNKILDQI